MLQVALADPDASSESLRATCEEALALGAQPERLIDALLTLASSERGLERSELLDLDALAESILLSRRQEAERQGPQIHTSLASAPISGDTDLIESMVANLLDKAIRRNITGGTIDIMTGLSYRQARFSISNTSPRIAAADLERLFQSF